MNSSNAPLHSEAPRPTSRQPWLGRSAIVSGGSAGLGFAIAEALASQVDRLVIIARDENRLAAAAQSLRAGRVQLLLQPILADVSTRKGTQHVRQSLEEMGGKFDLLINAVGRSDRGRILELDPTKLDDLIHANVTSTLLTSQAAVPFLSPTAVIVNIGSLASHFAPRYLGGYSIAKHALKALTQQMRLELAEQGIHVLHVCPGPIKSHRTESRYADLESAKSLPAEALQGGGGAKVRGLDPQTLAVEILQSAAIRRLELVRPWKARLLIAISAISPRWGDWILRRSTG